MIEKIKSNTNKIVVVLTAIAMYFFGSSVISYLDNSSMSASNYIYLGTYIAFFVSALYLFVLGLKNQLTVKSVTVPALILLVAFVVRQGNVFYNSQTFSNIPLLALVSAILILWLVSLSNSKVKNVLLLLIAVFASAQLISLLGASTFAAAVLAVMVSVGVVILNDKKGEE